MQYLAAGMVPGKLSTPCNELSYLSLRINFNNLDECLAALCLLRSSPNLRELEIGVRFLAKYINFFANTQYSIFIISALNLLFDNLRICFSKAK